MTLKSRSITAIIITIILIAIAVLVWAQQAGKITIFGDQVTEMQKIIQIGDKLDEAIYDSSKASIADGKIQLLGHEMSNIIAGAGPKAENTAAVKVFKLNGSTQTQISSFNAWPDQGGDYGTNVAAGDVNGDGVDEIITGAGPKPDNSSYIKVFDKNGKELNAFRAWEGSDQDHDYGVNVAAGDIDGDGKDEIIAGAGPKAENSPAIKVFKINGTARTQVASFRAWTETKDDDDYGVNVAVIKNGEKKYPTGVTYISNAIGGGTNFRDWYYFDRAIGLGITPDYETNGGKITYQIIDAEDETLKPYFIGTDDKTCAFLQTKFLLGNPELESQCKEDVNIPANRKIKVKITLDPAAEISKNKSPWTAGFQVYYETLGDYIKPLQIENVQVQVNNDDCTKAIVSWTASSDVDLSKYYIRWSASQEEVAEEGGIPVSKDNTSYEIRGLEGATKYYVSVKAESPGGQSNPAVTEFTTITCQGPADTTAPTTPASFTAQAVGSSGIKLSWTASTDNIGVTGYNIYNAANNQLVGTTSDTKFSLSGFDCATTYKFYIKAHDAAGNESEASDIVEIKTGNCTGSSKEAGTTVEIAKISELVSTGGSLWFNILVAFVLAGGITYFLLRKKENK